MVTPSPTSYSVGWVSNLTTPSSSMRMESYSLNPYPVSAMNSSTWMVKPSPPRRKFDKTIGWYSVQLAHSWSSFLTTKMYQWYNIYNSCSHSRIELSMKSIGSMRRRNWLKSPCSWGRIRKISRRRRWSRRWIRRWNRSKMRRGRRRRNQKQKC